ncbi:MAG: hypothetical protein OXF03_02790 [Gammaproteobacteria bacterium]|nr:hypothetical protein [Gammaproteobacteria bacterium]MCY4341291.1 hypothetical protein [Gammaproteobacteria bacterium]
MPQVLFNTHAAARKLEKAGHTAQQAEAVVEVVSTATELVTRMAQDLDRIKYQVDNNMATKDDIAALRMANKNDIDELRMATKDDIAALRTEIRVGIAKIPQVVREVLREETPTIQLRSVMAAGSLSFSLAGLAVLVLTDEFLRAIALEHSSLIGLMMILASSLALLLLARPGKS